MYRARFYANLDDYRSVKWPVKYPYWRTGESESHSIVVAYVDSIEDVYECWPEAQGINMGDEVDSFLFTSRFEKPEWFNEAE